jgi:activator of HSP90 ATPase
MTGGEAEINSKVGSPFIAWDGYITGTNIELKSNQKIVQNWRTSEFNKNDESSILTITLKEVENGTELTLNHKNIPEGQTQYKNGWVENYFQPMKNYFEG